MRVTSYPRKVAISLCAVLVAGYLAAPFCPIARPERGSCCDPETGCGAGLRAPDCCKYEPGQTGSAPQQAERTAAQALSAGCQGTADVEALLTPTSLLGRADLPSSTGDPPPLYLLHASLLL